VEIVIQQKILTSLLILVHSGRGMRPKQCLNLVLKSYDLCRLNPRASGRTRAGLSLFPSALFFFSFLFVVKVPGTCHVPGDMSFFQKFP